MKDKFLLISVLIFCFLVSQNDFWSGESSVRIVPRGMVDLYKAKSSYPISVEIVNDSKKRIRLMGVSHC